MAGRASRILAALAFALMCGCGRPLGRARDTGEAGMASRRSFHLYLLIGQSNMAGRGDVEPQDQQPHPRVVALSKDDQWVPAVDPLHFDKPIAGVGPGLTFGKAMADAAPSARIGLIPCAAGGSPIRVWRPGERWEQTHSAPYDEAVRRTKLAMTTGVLKGILWHQGESDSNAEDAPLYAERLAELIRRLRKDLRAPRVPFVVAGLGDFVLRRTPHAAAVNEALQRLPERVRRAAFVDASGLDHKGDGMHFSAEAARELGRRYATAMLSLQGR